MTTRPVATIDGALTVEEAAAWLDPPFPGGARQLYDLLAALKVRPAGVRPTGRKGRPPVVYDPAELMRLHAANAEWLFPPAPSAGCER